MNVKHEQHVDTSESNSNFIQNLNLQLQTLGASGLTAEEHDFLTKAYKNGPPKTILEAKESLRKKTKRRPKLDVETSKESTFQTDFEAKYNKQRKKFKKLAVVKKNLQEKNKELELRLAAVSKSEDEENRLTEKLEATEQIILNLEETKQQLDLELTELKQKLGNANNMENSQLNDLKRKLTQITDQHEHDIKEKEREKQHLSQSNISLQEEIVSLKEQVTTAMKLDVQEVQAKYQKEIEEIKNEATRNYNELKKSYEEEMKQEAQSREDKDRLDAENGDLKNKIETLQKSEVNVVELKKSYFQEMQMQKAQMILELKKMKEKWDNLRETHTKLSNSYQLLLNERQKERISSINADQGTLPSEKNGMMVSIFKSKPFFPDTSETPEPESKVKVLHYL